MNYEVEKKIEHFLLKNDLELAISYIKNKMNEYPQSPFHRIFEKDFSNDCGEIGFEVIDFIHFCLESFDVRTVYLEMNGFYINPDLWFFDYFGYDRYYDKHNEDFLSDWQSEECEKTVLTGMEDIQQLYKAYLVVKWWQDDSCKDMLDYLDEELEKVYQEYENEVKGMKEIVEIKKMLAVIGDVTELCDWMVNFKFMSLINKAIILNKKQINIPILCTAHDYRAFYHYIP